MNVAFDPWIPVVTTSGERKLAGLCTVLTEGDGLADLAVRPHERVALMRLFLDANVLFLTVMATKMPFVGRG